MNLRGATRGILSFGRSGQTALLVANLAGAIVAVVTGIITSRALGPDGRGDLAVILSWPALFALVVDAAVSDTLTIRVSAGAASLRAHVRNAAVVAALGSLVGVALAFLLLPLLLRPEQQHLLGSARTFLAFIPISLLAAVPTGAFLGLGRFRTVAAIRLVSNLIYVASLLVLAWTGHATPQSLACLTIGAVALPLALGAVALLGPLLAASHAREPLIPHLRDGVRLQGTRITGALPAVVDRALANLTLGQVGIGVYQIPVAFYTVIPVVPQAFAQVLFSRYNAVLPTTRPGLVLSAYVRTVLLAGGICLLAAPALPFLIPLVYGSDFALAIVPALIVLPAALAAASSQVLQAAARAALHVAPCIESEVIAVPIVALAAWPLTREFGPTGLALALGLGRIVAYSWLWFRVPPLLGLSRRALLPTSPAFRAQVRAELRAFRDRVFGPPLSPEVTRS